MELGVFFATLAIGFVEAGRRNIRELGRKKGVAFTLFAIVWSFGAAIAVIATVVALLKVFIQIVLICIIMGMLSGRYAKSVPQPPKPKYYDSMGYSYGSKQQRDYYESLWRQNRK